MPYRRSRWILLALFPLVLVAFWPGYFGVMRTASFAFHAHGLAATAWLVLVAVQLWSIHARRVRLHRAAGLLTFVVVPLFAAGSLLAMRDNALLSAAKADPFHAAFGMRLDLVDLVAVTTLVTLVAVALRHRRRVGLHAGAMVATVLLALPPVLARLLTGPLIGLGGLSFVSAFSTSFHMAQLCAAALALLLARGESRAPMLAVAAMHIGSQLLFETLGRTAAWEAALMTLAAVPPLPLGLVGLVLAVAALGFGWARGGRGRAFLVRPSRPSPQL
ncbi:hypothetical protein [Sphingomonas jatrophae]|uniref:Uncharacterized protein n=1 Tax=Sphingomonas jatrophae TaxID=1166337 RepID=A0A1I6LLL2_9SPHN|nr:hypothetical protein [Sphingomonas jatrophae]SFS04258.1 hypothetical protein SAMN05192580_2905 [Sphingomonas jatrophae]